MTPTIGSEGDALTITGAGFFGAGCYNFSLNGLELTGTPNVSSNGQTMWGCTVPGPVLGGTLAVLNLTLDGLHALNTVNFRYRSRMVSVSPTAGSRGDALTLNGFGFVNAHCNNFTLNGFNLTGMF